MRIPLNLLIAFFVILIFSISTIWSTYPSLAINQVTFILFASFVAIILAKRSPWSLKAAAFPAYIIVILSLLLTFILGQVTRGAIRWISFGPFNLQASEITKPLLILSFAHFFSQPIRKPYLWLLTRIGLLIPIAILVLLQPDLGSTIIISVIWLGMLFATKLPPRIILSLIGIFLLTIPLGLKFLQPYQLERLTSFANPYSDPSGSGYHVIQSQIAIGSGKIIGKGIRQGTQSQLKFLPERHTDFAYASFAEEFGFVGSILLIFAFITILFFIAKKTNNPDHFSQLIAVGAFWQFYSQMIINLGMNLAVMPVTGITLPLFSYGGSSLLSFGLTIGLIIATMEKTD